MIYLKNNIEIFVGNIVIILYKQKPIFIIIISEIFSE